MARCPTLLLFVLALGLPPRVADAQDCQDPALTMAAVRTISSGARDLTRLARAEGSELPVVRGLETRDGDDAAVRRFMTELADQAGAPIVCGEAASEGRRLVLAGERPAQLTIEAGTARVELAEGWREARLYLRDTNGATRERPFENGRAEIPSDLERPIDVQVVARGADGPRPVAERVLGRVTRRQVVRSDEPLPVRITRLRASEGVSELRPNRLLTRVAERHAAEVCRSGRVGHLGRGGDPVARLAREGIRARHVGETAARSRDIAGAYAATLNSPSHRAALTDRRFTDVGIGTAGGRCLVVLLAAWPRAIPY